MSQMRRGLKNATENKYVFRCSLKVVSDSPVSRRLNDIVPCALAGGSEGTVTEGSSFTAVRNSWLYTAWSKSISSLFHLRQTQ